MKDSLSSLEKSHSQLKSLNPLQKTTDLVFHSRLEFCPEKHALTVHINVFLCILFPICNNSSFIQEELSSVEVTDDSSLDDNAVLHEEINGELMFDLIL